MTKQLNSPPEFEQQSRKFPPDDTCIRNVNGKLCDKKREYDSIFCKEHDKEYSEWAKKQRLVIEIDE